MTPDKQNSVIAEVIGWKHLKPGPVKGIVFGYCPTGEYIPVPDFCNDLNKMHEAEQYLYRVENGWSKYTDFGLSVCAEAFQRAEAFLRAVDRWED